MTKLSRKNWILYFAWRLVHRVSSGCDWKNTEQCLEEKIKMISCIKCLLLLYLIVAKSKKLNQSTKECRINGIIVAIKILIIKKVLLQLKLWNKIKTAYKRLDNGHPLTCMQLLACILKSCFRVDTHICCMENNSDGHLLNGFRF